MEYLVVGLVSWYSVRSRNLKKATRIKSLYFYPHFQTKNNHVSVSVTRRYDCGQNGQGEYELCALFLSSEHALTAVVKLTLILSLNETKLRFILDDVSICLQVQVQQAQQAQQQAAITGGAQPYMPPAQSSTPGPSPYAGLYPDLADEYMGLQLTGYVPVSFGRKKMLPISKSKVRANCCETV